MTSRSRSLGMTMSVSTFWEKQIAALLCLIATQTTFETERLGDDADRKSAPISSRAISRQREQHPCPCHRLRQRSRRPYRPRPAPRESRRETLLPPGSRSGFAPAPRPRVNSLADVEWSYRRRKAEEPVCRCSRQ